MAVPRTPDGPPLLPTTALNLVEDSLILTGRLRPTLDLLTAGRIDYARTRVLTDLLATVTNQVAQAVQDIVLPRAPGLTPGGLAAATRRALARVDAAAMRARHARARRSADVGYYPTQDGMARLYADLPLPVAAACLDTISGHAAHRKNSDDGMPPDRADSY